jgi:hypothetical protein|tara:strand:- start:896 stop:1105 length:210 start_codon:yes stop_codon:yes gene_type:complete
MDEQERFEEVIKPWMKEMARQVNEMHNAMFVGNGKASLMTRVSNNSFALKLIGAGCLALGGVIIKMAFF